MYCSEEFFIFHPVSTPPAYVPRSSASSMHIMSVYKIFFCFQTFFETILSSYMIIISVHSARQKSAKRIDPPNTHAQLITEILLSALFKQTNRKKTRDTVTKISMINVLISLIKYRFISLPPNSFSQYIYFIFKIILYST